MSETVKKIFRSGPLRRVISGLSGVLMVVGSALFLEYHLPPLTTFLESFFNFAAYFTVFYVTVLLLGGERLFYSVTGMDALSTLITGSGVFRSGTWLILLFITIATLLSALAYPLAGTAAALGSFLYTLDLWYG